MVNIVPDKRYDFSTLAPIALGAVRKNVLCTGVLTYGLANTLSNKPIPVLAAAVLPEIGNSDINYRNFTYYHFKSDDGTTFVLPLEWIDTGTIKTVSTDSCIFTFMKITPEQKAEIKKFLAILGVSNYTVS